MKREKFSSRLGFLLITAGCAIGLGNVWRFPFITGQYGGAAFVLIYLFFLLIFGLPIMVMELSVGRASQLSAVRSFDALEPKGTKWHWTKYCAIIGNYMLMMFYTTVCGWMLNYVFKMGSGQLNGLNAEQIGQTFNHMLADPIQQVGFMLVSCAIGFIVCSKGLQKGVEKVSKFMMGALFAVMGILVIRAVTLPNAIEGLKFYLIPDFQRISEAGIGNAVFAAMNQSFFTLSLGIGAIAIFGSYIDKKRRLFSEAVNITILDTLVAFISGLIIFPACAAFGIAADQGPGLIFVTLPNVFNQMPLGSLWGTLFFIFMFFAALTTIIAVFENIIAFGMDMGLSRQKAVAVNAVLVPLLSLPCALGFNVLSFLQPLGEGKTIQDLEDFIVSSNLLPLGSICYLMFCTSRYGWGWDNFIAEANTGEGWRFPKGVRFYVTWILPIIVFVVFIQGYSGYFGQPWNILLPLCLLALILSMPIHAYWKHRKQ